MSVKFYFNINYGGVSIIIRVLKKCFIDVVLKPSFVLKNLWKNFTLIGIPLIISTHPAMVQCSWSSLFRGKKALVINEIVAWRKRFWTHVQLHYFLVLVRNIISKILLSLQNFPKKFKMLHVYSIHVYDRGD